MLLDTAASRFAHRVDSREGGTIEQGSTFLSLRDQRRHPLALIIGGTLTIATVSV
jgi:hypothetical protein